MVPAVHGTFNAVMFPPRDIAGLTLYMHICADVTPNDVYFGGVDDGGDKLIAPNWVASV